MSRARNSNNVKYFVEQPSCQGPVSKGGRILTHNVVYAKLFLLLAM
jgi:hypothetical protein